MTPKKLLRRTVAYYQLVEVPKDKAAPELDWNKVLRSMGTKSHTYRVEAKEVFGRVTTLEPLRDWWPFFTPEEMDDLRLSWHDETAFVLALSTDKDHVPNQRKEDGDLIPMRHDEDGRPATAVFLWFLPFGNIFGLIREDNTAIQPKFIVSWINRYLRENDLLPRNDFSFGVVPVVDKETQEKFSKARSLSTARLRGKVRGSEPSFLRDILGGGPKLEGSFDITVQIKPVKTGSPDKWETDTEKLYNWFDDVFGNAAGLDAATVRFANTPDQDDLPTEPINMFQHRITRKRQVVIAGSSGNVPSLSAHSAGTEIINAYVEDYEELRRHRY